MSVLAPPLHGSPKGILSWLQANLMNFLSSSCTGEEKCVLVCDSIVNFKLLVT